MQQEQCVALDRVGEAIAAAARRNLKLKGDIQAPEIEVRFAPNTGHSEAHAGLPLLLRVVGRLPYLGVSYGLNRQASDKPQGRKPRGD